MTPETTDDKTLAQFYRDLDAIENRRSSWNGPCVDCKFFYQHSYFATPLCQNPIVTGTTLDPVSGKVKLSKDMECEDARNDEEYIGAMPGDRGVCGASGKFFLPKPPPVPQPEPPPEPELSPTQAYIIIAKYIVAAAMGTAAGLWAFTHF